MKPRVRQRHRSLRTIVGWLLTLAVVVGWTLFLRPQSLGGTASFVTVDGVSMTPTMHSGDLALVERKPSYHVGDVVAYRIPRGYPGAGHNIIHRIVGGDAQRGFVTKGDHNKYDDYFWHPKGSDVIGKVWFHVPGLARDMGMLRRPVPFALVVGLATFVLVAWPSKRRYKAMEPTERSSTPEPSRLDPEPCGAASSS